jgi:hypothetical protein
LCCDLLPLVCEVGPDMVAIIKAAPLAVVQWLEDWAESVCESEESKSIVSDVGQPQKRITTPAPITVSAAAMITRRSNTGSISDHSET